MGQGTGRENPFQGMQGKGHGFEFLEGFAGGGFHCVVGSDVVPEPLWKVRPSLSESLLQILHGRPGIDPGPKEVQRGAPGPLHRTRAEAALAGQKQKSAKGAEGVGGADLALRRASGRPLNPRELLSQADR